MIQIETSFSVIDGDGHTRTYKGTCKVPDDQFDHGDTGLRVGSFLRFNPQADAAILMVTLVKEGSGDISHYVTVRARPPVAESVDLECPRIAPSNVNGFLDYLKLQGFIVTES